MSTLSLALHENKNFILRGTDWEMHIPEWCRIPNGDYWFRAPDDKRREVFLACRRSADGLTFTGEARTDQ